MSEELTLSSVVEAEPTVTHPEEGEPTGSAQGADALPAESAEAEGEAKPYTDDEVVGILEKDGALDARRLTPTQKLIQKSFERGVTQKFQEAARLKSEVETQRNQLQEWYQQEQNKLLQQQNPEMWVFQQYLQNPQAVIRDINTSIAEFEKVSPYNEEEYAKARANIAKLQGYKDTFREARESMYVNQAMLHQSKVTMDAELAKLPDYQNIAPKMAEYAVKELGLLPQDIAFFQDPAIPYGLGTRIQKALYSAYTKMNAGKLKEIKNPPALGRPGSPSGVVSREDAPPDDPVEFRKWWKQRGK